MAISTKNKVIGAGVGGTVLLIGGLIAWKHFGGKVKLIKDVKNFKNSTVGSINIIEAARSLGQDLGTIYGTFDPRHWTENDSSARDTLLQIPKSLIPQVSLEYATLTKSNMQADCQRLLPASDYAKVRTLFI